MPKLKIGASINRWMYKQTNLNYRKASHLKIISLKSSLTRPSKFFGKLQKK